MMKIFFAFFLMLLFGGCFMQTSPAMPNNTTCYELEDGYPLVRRTMYIDDSFTSTELKYILEAVSKWKKATG